MSPQHLGLVVVFNVFFGSVVNILIVLFAGSKITSIFFIFQVNTDTFGLRLEGWRRIKQYTSALQWHVRELLLV